jgi:hypothetical protein
MAVTEPPVCQPCVRTASRLCPALYRGGSLVPVAVDVTTVPYDDPAVRWMRAVSLVRELGDCTLVTRGELSVISGRQESRHVDQAATLRLQNVTVPARGRNSHA